ncbi:c-type cytochrome [Aneurinibacillus thermoaerophilus]|uniref:c-type cytochrome n=1 Tax=Aneurinibacillus thermoaerophilus TaxID=143495 RepID=UPI0038D19EB6
MKGDGQGAAPAPNGGTVAPAEPKAGGGESAAAPTGGTAEEGKTIANQCMACHGQDLNGGAGAPTLHGVVDKLKPEGVAEVLKNGRGGMPPIGASWSDQQMSSMIEYLKTLK